MKTNTLSLLIATVLLMFTTTATSQKTFICNVVDEHNNPVSRIAYKAFFVTLNENHKKENVKLTDGEIINGEIRFKYNPDKPNLFISIDNKGYKGELKRVADIHEMPYKMIVVRMSGSTDNELTKLVTILQRKINVLSAKLSRLINEKKILEKERRGLVKNYINKINKLIRELQIEKEYTVEQEQKVNNLRITTRDLNVKNDSLTYEISVLNGRVAEMERRNQDLLNEVELLLDENFHARLKIKDIQINDISDNCMEISFVALDKNSLPILNKMVPFIIRVGKYNAKKNVYTPLKWENNNSNDFLLENIAFPTNRVAVRFCNPEANFGRKAKNKDEYQITISNKFDDLIETQIYHGLKNPTQNIIRDQAVINRETIMEKDTLFVNSETLKIRVWDNSEVDGDTVSLYLNGNLILDQYSTTANYRIIDTLKLNAGPNDLLLFAHSLGAIAPCTAHIELTYDRVKKKTIMLSADLKTNKSLIIYRKEDEEN